jgi:hypothetical protein
MQPVTFEQLGASLHYRNRIINGDMSVDQRNGGNQIAMPLGAPYIIDRWKFGNGNAVPSKGNLGQVLLTSPPAGFPFLYRLVFTTTVAYAPVANDPIRFSQFVEGYNFNDAQWGTANAQLIVLEFWAVVGSAGAYAVALQNAAATRSFVSTFTISAAGTWTKVRLNIPGDTGGTWAVASNAPAFCLMFPLCIGSTYQTSTLNAWQDGQFYSTSGAVNVLGAVNASLSITGVALMVGAAAANAEPEFRKYSDNLIDCQRYYQGFSSVRVSGWQGNANGPVFGAFLISPQLRAAPTVAFSNQTYTNASGLIDSTTNNSVFRPSITATAAGVGTCSFTTTLDADF